MKHKTREQRKQQKRTEAEKRNAQWAALTTHEKLLVLLERPGRCAKQVKKLAKPEEL